MSVKEKQKKAYFKAAKPIWSLGRELEKNILAGFRAQFCINDDNSKKVLLKIAASTLYRCYVNGKFVGHGPAVSPHGFYRVDEWDISSKTTGGNNIVAIEVAGYNVNSFCRADQPSFLQAEIVAGDKVLAATGDTGLFEATILRERIQKVQRYSYQRIFVEAYRLSPDYAKWREDSNIVLDTAECTVTDTKNLIERRVSYPKFAKTTPTEHTLRGRIKTGVTPETYWKDRGLTDVSDTYKGFYEDELEVILSKELQEIETVKSQLIGKRYSNEDIIDLDTNEFEIIDFGMNLSGFMGAEVTCSEDSRLMLIFDEILVDGDVDFKRLLAISAISYEMKKGTYKIESLEPYTLRYLKLLVLKGKCKVGGLYIREYCNPDTDNARFECSDNRINTVFKAGLETFKQNAVENFTDCPSRERAGWLCDSFFTGRTEYYLTGRSLVETNFIENYMLPNKYPCLPEGMLPMCYPADFNRGEILPNWALWFVIQLEEYLYRTGNAEMIEALRPKVIALFEYFEAFKNEDGLLEKLEGWVFVEWSMANKLVQDVNYPTNMLYAKALEVAGKLYDLPNYTDESIKIHETVRKQSYNGEFFVDHAVREDGRLVVKDDTTEVCQYYAFFCGTADKERFPSLWETLLRNFGPNRKKTGKYPHIHIANAFIGNYLRFEILSGYGYVSRILQESVDFFLYMAEKTGTLWEHIDTRASCNHGFASHITYSYYRDLLGIYKVDKGAKTIKLRFSDTGLKWCKGIIPLGEEKIEARWTFENGCYNYSATIPCGYKIELEKITDLPINLSVKY
ncbi:MAG: Bacterial alpha-L-rhamnosidase [Firmicutes bacterium ADurb.Bin193]|nr:MAG: Bacterial alpha-L-rhamnosidase [Firmicutes bacterium ADurb.Bin193]